MVSSVVYSFSISERNGMHTGNARVERHMCVRQREKKRERNPDSHRKSP